MHKQRLRDGGNVRVLHETEKSLVENIWVKETERL